jgi:hypothetical protein
LRAQQKFFITGNGVKFKNEHQKCRLIKTFLASLKKPPLTGAPKKRGLFFLGRGTPVSEKQVLKNII